jgi:hypothetical protein
MKIFGPLDLAEFITQKLETEQDLKAKKRD